jgi:hypothetical protein
MRTRSITLAALVLTFATAGTAHAATDPALDKVLRQLDAASATFKSAEADLQVDLYEKVVRETTHQYGTIYFKKAAAGTEMGLILYTAQDKKAVGKYVHFANGKGDMYDTIAKKDTTFNGGDNKARTESLLTLGFGGSGKDLEKAWTIKLIGNETIGGVATTELDLTPKDPSVAETVTHIQVWFDPTRSVSLRQVFYMPEGDTRTSNYTNIRLNSPVDTKKYAKR